MGKDEVRYEFLHHRAQKIFDFVQQVPYCSKRTVLKLINVVVSFIDHSDAALQPTAKVTLWGSGSIISIRRIMTSAIFLITMVAYMQFGETSIDSFGITSFLWLCDVFIHTRFFIRGVSRLGDNTLWVSYMRSIIIKTNVGTNITARTVF